MKRLNAGYLAAGLILAGLAHTAAAQAPAGAPAGANGICKDGTYSTAATKDGACRGHKGVQTWYTASTRSTAPAASTSAAMPAPARTNSTPSMPAATQAPAPAPSMPTPTPARSTSTSTEKAKLSSMQPAAGGGPGLVWVNTSSKVYHCQGSEFYGKTKQGAYMSEADAKAKGAHADHGKGCS